MAVALSLIHNILRLPADHFLSANILRGQGGCLHPPAGVQNPRFCASLPKPPPRPSGAVSVSRGASGGAGGCAGESARQRCRDGALPPGGNAGRATHRHRPAGGLRAAIRKDWLTAPRDFAASYACHTLAIRRPDATHTWDFQWIHRVTPPHAAPGCIATQSTVRCPDRRPHDPPFTTLFTIAPAAKAGPQPLRPVARAGPAHGATSALAAAVQVLSRHPFAKGQSLPRRSTALLPAMMLRPRSPITVMSEHETIPRVCQK